MVVGPYKQLSLPHGGHAPLYLLRFDRSGNLLSPQTASLLRQDATTASDVFVFAHGWNNDFGTALHRYLDFASGYMSMRADYDLPTPSGYAPVLVGLIWPSTALVLPWESGPAIAAPHDDNDDLLRFVSQSLGVQEAGRLAELVDGVAGLDDDLALAAARIVQGALATPDDDGRTATPSVESVLSAWRLIELSRGGPPNLDPDDFGTVNAGAAGDPAAAGGGPLDPRNLLRAATVWKMKARAGAVGANGVAQLLRFLREGTHARLHLVGHSFGARLLLSAIAAAPAQRKVHSLLLLQAAVNRWCFAPQVPDGIGMGGYHPVLPQVRRPVVATMSAHDMPLRQVFHLVMHSSLGEPSIAALGDTDRFGALGGYGAAGLGDRAITTPMALPGKRYEAFGSGHDVVVIDASTAITGHGEVSNPSTWWTLHNLTDEG